MSSVVLTKAAEVRAPWSTGTTHLFGVYKFTGGVSGTETTHSANAVNAELKGQWVEIYVTGGDLHYAFSTDSAAEVDRSVAAGADSAQAKVGAVIPNGETRHVFIPDADVTIYFVRESTAVGTIAYVRKACR